MKTYYLFLDKAFCIYNVFDSLKATRIIEPGIDYIQIKEDSIIPQCIVIKSIYKDEYFKDCLSKLLEDMGYDCEFQLLKPLVKEQAMI
jgi:hypothetical protein